MTIGLLQLNLFIPQSNSLKSKRQILRSLKDKIKHKFNVSIAEIGNLNKWQSQILAVACVSSDQKIVDATLSKIANLTEEQHSLELTDYKIDFY